MVCANATRHLNLEYDLQDCAAATENLLLQAVELGLGTCWLGGYPNQERVDQLNDMLNLPEEILPLWVIALGHPAREEKPKNKFCPHYIHWEQW